MKRNGVVRRRRAQGAPAASELRFSIALLVSSSASLSSPLIVAASRVQDSPAPPQISLTVDTLVQNRMTEYRVVGASIAVMRDGRLLKSAGYGLANLETGEAVTPTTAFFIASITKAFTSAAVLGLVEDGVVDLAAPVGRILPELPEAWRAATIRDLLAMTSGIPESIQSPGVPWPDYQTAVDRAAVMPLGPAGERLYGGMDYVLLGRLIEAIAREPFADFVQSRLFQRLGLRSAAFGDWRQVRPGRAEWYSVYNVENQDFSAERYVLRTDYPSYRWPSAGMFITAEDLATFVDALGSGRVLGPAGSASYWSPVTTADGAPNDDLLGSWGKVEDEEQLVWHEGGTRAAVLYDRRSRLTVVVLTNVQGGLPIQWIDAIYRLYAGG